MSRRISSLLWAIAIVSVALGGALWLQESRQFPWSLFFFSDLVGGVSSGDITNRRRTAWRGGALVSAVDICRGSPDVVGAHRRRSLGVRAVA
jgi:hypothetical protein